MPKAMPAAGVAKGKGKGKGKGKAPPPKGKGKGKKAEEKSSSCPPGAKAWKPTQGFKSGRTVNWTPIRQDESLQGSIWQQVNRQIADRENRDENQLVQKEALNKAFCSVAKAKRAAGARKSSLKMQKADSQKKLTRVLQGQQALNSDFLHKFLAQRGFADIDVLCKIVGVAPGASSQRSSLASGPDEGAGSDDSSSSSGSSDSGSESDSDSGSAKGSDSDSASSSSSVSIKKRKPKQKPEDEEALEMLMQFLQLADGQENQLKALKGDSAELSFAPAELLLQALVVRGGPAKTLKSRVQAKLTYLCFPRQADELERVISDCMQVANMVMNSKALLLFFQGTLLIGNYLNSSSQALGQAAGVTLESIPRLAHTKVLTDNDENAGPGRGGAQAPQSAFDLLISQLREKEGEEWLSTLASELEQCRDFCDVDATINQSMKDLTAKVKDFEKCYYPYEGCPEPPAAAQAHFKRFMAFATSRLATIRTQQDALESTATKMQKYFAEPSGTQVSRSMRSLTSLRDLLPRDNLKKPSRSSSKVSVAS